MKHRLLGILRCPACIKGLVLAGAQEREGEVESGLLQCHGCTSTYPILHFIPRFVASDHYVANFGFQWNRFERTQLDSYSGLTVSRDRFLRETGWTPESLKGQTVLDAGCGAGRFAEIALSCGAEVVAFDYSTAVDACWRNLGSHPRLHLLQADIYALPFERGSFDSVYCFGVLQHTPNVRNALMALPQQLRLGGRIAVDVYPRPAAKFLLPKYWLRPLTKRIPAKTLFGLVRLLVTTLLPVSIMIGRIPGLGKKARALVPVANYDGIYPLSRQQLYEWSLLDTYDMLSPAYDKPQRPQTLRAWLDEAGLADIQVFRAGALCGRAVMPEHSCSNGMGS